MQKQITYRFTKTGQHPLDDRELLRLFYRKVVNHTPEVYVQIGRLREQVPLMVSVNVDFRTVRYSRGQMNNIDLPELARDALIVGRDMIELEDHVYQKVSPKCWKSIEKIVMDGRTYLVVNDDGPLAQVTGTTQEGSSWVMRPVTFKMYGLEAQLEHNSDLDQRPGIVELKLNVADEVDDKRLMGLYDAIVAHYDGAEVEKV